MSPRPVDGDGFNARRSLALGGCISAIVSVAGATRAVGALGHNSRLLTGMDVALAG
jgi:hypothetical protein